MPTAPQMQQAEELVGLHIQNMRNGHRIGHMAVVSAVREMSGILNSYYGFGNYLAEEDFDELRAKLEARYVIPEVA